MDINGFQNQLNNDVILSENVKKQKKEKIRQNEIKKLGDELKIDTKNGYDTFKLLKEQNWVDPKGLFVNKYNIEKPTNDNKLDLNNDKNRYEQFNKLPTALQNELLDRVDTNKEFDLLLPKLERTVKRDKYLMMKDYGSLNNTFGDETGSIIGYFGASMATAMADPTLAAIDIGAGLATGGVGYLGSKGVRGLITAYKLLSRGKKYYKNLSKVKQTLVDSAFVGVNAGFQEKLLQNSTIKGENNGDIIMSAAAGAVLGGGISGLARIINHKKFKVENLKSTDLNKKLKELDNIKEEDISNIKPKSKQENNNIDNLNIDKSTKQENVNEAFNEYKNNNKLQDNIENEINIQNEELKINNIDENLKNENIDNIKNNNVKEINNIEVKNIINNYHTELSKVKSGEISLKEHNQFHTKKIRKLVEQKKRDFNSGVIKEKDYIDFIKNVKNAINNDNRLKNVSIFKNVVKKVSRNERQVKKKGIDIREQFKQNIDNINLKIKNIKEKDISFKKLDELNNVKNELKNVKAQSIKVQETAIKNNSNKIINHMILRDSEKLLRYKNISLNDLEKINTMINGIDLKKIDGNFKKVKDGLNFNLDKRIKETKLNNKNIITNLNNPRQFKEIDYGNILNKEEANIMEEILNNIEDNLDTIFGSYKPITISREIKEIDNVKIKDTTNIEKSINNHIQCN